MSCLSLLDMSSRVSSFLKSAASPGLRVEDYLDLSYERSSLFSGSFMFLITSISEEVFCKGVTSIIGSKSVSFKDTSFRTIMEDTNVSLFFESLFFFVEICSFIDLLRSLERIDLKDLFIF